MQCRRQFSWYRLCHPLGRFSRPYPNMIPNLFTSTLHVQESTALLSTLPVSPFTLADLNHPRTSLDHRGTSLISSFLLHGPIRSPIVGPVPPLESPSPVSPLKHKPLLLFIFLWETPPPSHFDKERPKMQENRRFNRAMYNFGWENDLPTSEQVFEVSLHVVVIISDPRQSPPEMPQMF